MCTNPYRPIPPPKDPEELLKEAEKRRKEKEKMNPCEIVADCVTGTEGEIRLSRLPRSLFNPEEKSKTSTGTDLLEDSFR